jgi:serine/threonine protein kinase
MNVLSTLSIDKKYVGSLNYAAPEVIKKLEYDQSIDIFSIGIIMYYMLSGTLPFDSSVP